MTSKSTRREVLADGAGVVVKVDSKPGGSNDQYWVRVLSSDAKDGKIRGPWPVPGKELTVLSRYFAEGWTPEKAICISVGYRMACGREVIDPAEGQ